jgi:rfaE bifunctional protein nucleotidyltransferase chain/domain
LGQVVSQSELISRRGQWKRAGHGVVCASGCFDLLHPGHIRLLEHARSLGAVLVVAIESDAAARAHFASRKELAKNRPARPITPAAERSEILAALAAVDAVVEFDGPSPREIFNRFQPDVIVMGGIPGSDPALRRQVRELEELGCKVVHVPLEPGHSTTNLIERILELRV